MKEYLDLLRKVRNCGEIRHNRTGIDTLSLFGEQIKIELSEGFPLLTTKKVYFKGIIGELVWFLHGDTNISFLQENGIHIWDAWADENKDLGPIYGKQWRDWNGIDQLQNIVDTIKKDPFSRRIILNSWNVSELKKMALPPCHVLAQFYVRDKFLDCSVYQRSGDIFLGVPFDIASYAALIHLISQECGLLPGKLIYNFGDIHIYTNHIKAVDIQLSRKPSHLPSLSIKKGVTINTAEITDFYLDGYVSQGALKAEVAI